jgi:hypothetical protein
MSEYPAINLILGLIGTVTGSIARIISYMTYRKDKPRLKVIVTDCIHNFNDALTHINLWANFQIQNQGDRGTRISDLSLSFTINKKGHTLKKQNLGETRGGSVTSVWIEAHDTESFTAYFSENFESNLMEKLESIDCTFTIYHTHEPLTIKTTSKFRERSRL